MSLDFDVGGAGTRGRLDGHDGPKAGPIRRQIEAGHALRRGRVGPPVDDDLEAGDLAVGMEAVAVEEDGAGPPRDQRSHWMLEADDEAGVARGPDSHSSVPGFYLLTRQRGRSSSHRAMICRQ